MQFKKLIALVVILATVLAAGKTRLQDTKTVLAEMEKSQFGATMLSAIQMNIAAENQIEEITVFIEEIIDSIQQEQDAADEKNRSDQSACDENIQDLQQEIAETKATIISTTNAINENEKVLETAKANLKQAEQDFDETVEAIESGTEQREKEHSRWVEEDYQNQISIATLEEGVKLINHMIHGVAFSQIKSRYDKVLEKLSDNNSKHSSLFKPLISSLTQLATKLNYENVMKILDLLNNIRVSIVEERENGRIAEEKSQADWEKLLNHLTSEKQRLADKKAKLRNLIDATTQLLAQLRESLESNQNNLENAEKSLSEWQTKCAAQSEQYESQSSERSQALVILNKLLDHLKEKFASVSEYVASRTGPDF